MVLNFIACGNEKVPNSTHRSDLSEKQEMPETKHHKIMLDLEELRRLESADAAIDLGVALKNGDERFIGYILRSLTVPQIPDANYELFRDARTGTDNFAVTVDNKRYGVKLIKGMSDNIMNDEHLRLMGITTNYATEYNFLLYHYLVTKDSQTFIPTSDHHTDPAKILQSAIRKKDFRFMAIGGYVPEIPVENPDGTIDLYMKDKSYLKYGINDIANVADENEVVEIVRKFAAKYNHLLLEYLKEQESKQRK